MECHVPRRLLRLAKPRLRARLRQRDIENESCLAVCGICFRGIVGQYIANPTTPRTIQHGFAFAVLNCRADAERKKLLNNLSLCGSCRVRTASATACVLH